MSNQPIVFVVDDDQAVRESLAWLIQSVGLAAETFGSAQAFLDSYAAAQRHGCVVLDIRMPGMSGLELHRTLVEREIHVPVIIITGHGDVPMAVRALKAGVFDFIEKPFNDQVLLDCINLAISQDRQQRDQSADLDVLVQRCEQLTPREGEVMGLVVEGLSNKEIGNRMGVSLKTVEAHRAKVMEKLQARSLSELVRMAVTVERAKE